jgi:hypothetical protein
MMRLIFCAAVAALAAWWPSVTAAQICRYSTWMHTEMPVPCCADPTRACPQPDNPVCNQIVIDRPVFDCEGNFSFFASDTAFACPCSPQGQAFLAVRCSGCIAATTCEDPSCSPPPLSCDGIDDDDDPPVDPGCLDDEHGCSFLDKDPFPVRYSTGYVETNPLVLFSAPTPDGAFFGVRVVYGSHLAHLPARRPTGGTGPVVRRQDEYTHFLGQGFIDNVSDRLVIEVPGQDADTVGWVRADGVTTFNRVPSTNRYESAGGRFQLLDRGSGQAPRWVVTSTDTSRTTQVWGFEEFSIVTYGGNAGRLARLTRRSLSASWLDITGFYGYDVAWTSDGRVDNVVDTLGRELRYIYSSVLVNGVIERWQLDTIRFVVAPTTTPIDVAKFRYRVGYDLLERVERPGVPGYSRFLYFRDPPGPPTCPNCGGLLTDVIAASIAAATPAPGAPVQSTETVVEHHDYEFTTDGSRPRAMRSRGPGRSYAYKYAGSVTTQYDLHQTSGPCT